MSEEEAQTTEGASQQNPGMGPETSANQRLDGTSLFQRLSDLLKPLAIERFRIIDLADPEQTISGIKKDIEFRGFNLWILVFSIVICSIGLNVDSAAVVIGAMLISPLMGPIMGLGLGLGTNDAGTFKNALGNLGVASGIAILTSALYFAFSPLEEASSELLSRTQPTLLDVVVALFGGLAGILAGSRREKSNVIPGVAIATALMPPLCTAGYGLANGEWNFLLGGFYLFLINTALIALATWIVVRYLRFPLLHYLEPALERKYKRLSALLFLALLCPSVFIFYNVVHSSREDIALRGFVSENMNMPGATVDVAVDRELEPAALVVTIVGGSITEEMKANWQRKFAATHPAYTLEVRHTGIDEADLELLREQVSFMMSSYSDLTAKERRIEELNAELTLTQGKLSQLEATLLPTGLGAELLSVYPAATRIRWGRLNDVLRDGDMTPTGRAQLEVLWADSLPEIQRDSLERAMTEWFRIRLDTEAPLVVTIAPAPPSP